MSKDEFIFEWTKRLRLKQDPFQDKIQGDLDEAFSGYEKERKKVNLFVLERYSFGTIHGEKGSGKTLTLKWIHQKLKKHSDKVRVAYINASELSKERDLIEGLALPLLNAYEKLAKKHEKLRLEELGKFVHNKAKGKRYLLILLDDVGSLPKRYVTLFKYFFDNDLNVQVMAAGTKQEIANSGITDIHDKDSLKVKLGGLSFEECLDLLKKRIKEAGQEDIFPFEEKALKKIYEKCNGNPLEFLKSCRESAIKLSLDSKYVKKELARVEEIRKKAREEKIKKEDTGKGLISIRLGDSKEEMPKSEDDLLEAPEFSAQEEMLAELVDMPPEPPKVKYDGKDEETIPLEIEEMAPEPIEETTETYELLEDIVPVNEDKEEKKEKKPEKQSWKEKREAKQTEELLDRLAREFEKK